MKIAVDGVKEGKKSNLSVLDESLKRGRSERRLAMGINGKFIHTFSSTSGNKLTMSRWPQQKRKEKKIRTFQFTTHKNKNYKGDIAGFFHSYHHQTNSITTTKS